MRIYVHEEGRHEAEAVDVADGPSIAEGLGIGGGEEIAVFLEDQDEPLDAGSTPQEAGVADRSHVFRGRPRRIDVTVSFNGERRVREFGISTRVQRVFRWATGERGFALSMTDAAEHTLALAGTNEIPAGDVHLGSLDDASPGRVAFALIPKHRYEG
jgi:hypothetical protein